MSATQTLAFIYICSEADSRTGIWNGSAGALSGELGISQRTARDVLERMEYGGYIRRFTVPGRRACYPILVHKFYLTDGEHNGELLDALSSTDANTLQYLSPENREHRVGRNGKHHGEHGAAQKRKRIEKEKEKEENPAANPTPRPISHHKSIFDSCYEAYQARFGNAPTWGGKEAKFLQRFLREHPSISHEEVSRRYEHLLASTDSYHAQKHGSLLHLLSNFDAFADGPIVRIQKGDSNGRAKSGFDPVATAEAFGFGKPGLAC